MKRLIERYGTGRIRTINDKGNPGGLDIGYEYDACGNVIAYEQGGTQESFGYNARNQLATWIDANGVPHSYTYDPAGNLTARTGSPSPTTPARLVAHTNARGDMVSLTDKTSDYPIVGATARRWGGS